MVLYIVLIYLTTGKKNNHNIINEQYNLFLFVAGRQNQQNMGTGLPFCQVINLYYDSFDVEISLLIYY